MTVSVSHFSLSTVLRPSSFKFISLVGRSPLRYQNEWRLTLAKSMPAKQEGRIALGASLSTVILTVPVMEAMARSVV